MVRATTARKATKARADGSATTTKPSSRKSAKTSPNGGKQARAEKKSKTGTKTAKATSSRFTTAEKRAIRETLHERKKELEEEYTRAMEDLRDLQSERTVEGSGDDQADAGSHTFEREQELALAHGILERIGQVEHAEARLDSGTYGQCEQCGNPIPKARLEVFPAATLCVDCKQAQERR